jgi:glycosyltransferase involved in cell wall biosynthesis
MRPTVINPDTTEFVILSFEGPDRYSLAGGLGTRVTELARALASQGYRTHIFFVGDPDLPGEEILEDGRLIYHRWCQWLSRMYPNGVYDGEEDKLRDFGHSVPSYVTREIVGPAAAAGRAVAVLAEEWQTADTTSTLSDQLYQAGLRWNAILFWNANNIFGFDRLNWGRLGFTATLTTVSRYMKHVMWRQGVNPLVIPNGIPARLLEPVNQALVDAFQRLYAGSLFLFKIGRFDPDKRWMMAVEAAARLKERGHHIAFPLRGGIEPHGADVLGYAYSRGLRVIDVTTNDRSPAGGLAALTAVAGQGDIYNLRFFVHEEMSRALYGAADGVLANSGHEPFGLVGLEGMAAGGLVFTGASGEDYAISMSNCVVVETDDPEEICANVLYLREHPALVERMRVAARQTATRFTWEEVIANLVSKLEYVGHARGVLYANAEPR